MSKLQPYKRKRAICLVCNNLKPVDNVNNKLMCRECRRKETGYKKPKCYCFICGEYKTRNGFIKNKPVCISCYRKRYKKPKSICSVCGKLKERKIIRNDKPICEACYRRYFYERKKGLCFICHKNKPIWTTIKNKDYCKNCNDKRLYKKRMIEENLKRLDDNIPLTTETKLSVNQERLYKLLLKTYPYLNILPFKTFDWLGQQHLDIYIEDYKIAIEYDGKQHNSFVPYFHKDLKAFLEQKERDERKDKLCKDNGIVLIRWDYAKKINEKNVKELLGGIK